LLIYRMPSMATKLPVSPTAFGTVMLKKNVARLLEAASAAIRSVRTFSMMWMPLSVSSMLCTMKGSFGVSPRVSAHGPGVAPARDDLLGDEPRGGVLADAGLARVVQRVLRRELLEEIAPAGVDDDDVTLAQRDVVHLESGLEVGGGDDRALLEARLLAGRVALELVGLLIDLHHVDEHATGREGLEVLEPELGHVVLGDELPHRDLVVVAVLAPDVPHPVEMRADVALAEPGVFHVGQLVL